MLSKEEKDNFYNKRSISNMATTSSLATVQSKNQL